MDRDVETFARDIVEDEERPLVQHIQGTVARLCAPGEDPWRARWELASCIAKRRARLPRRDEARSLLAVAALAFMEGDKDRAHPPRGVRGRALNVSLSLQVATSGRWYATPAHALLRESNDQWGLDAVAQLREIDDAAAALVRGDCKPPA